MFLGMRGTNDWVAGQRPLNWRQQIMYLYPNGMAPLTAILSMMGSKKVDDPNFNWWTQEQSVVAGDVDNVYDDAGLTTAYTVNPGINTTIFVVITTVLGNRVREGHQILLRDASDYSLDVVGKVTGVTRGGVNTTLAVLMLEADDNSSIAGTLADCDNFKIIGNIIIWSNVKVKL